MRITAAPPEVNQLPFGQRTTQTDKDKQTWKGSGSYGFGGIGKYCALPYPQYLYHSISL
ncbi:hypothetical protein [Nitrosomonas sp. Is37]|uniref:hypothetical protein n=1 Tax=Nitrosomonas sp. Is37 TaxID=3080535 RepID=UPI00294B49F9|nr:hypothetical protein [Nitrosomonas sp. Is37]MDV6345491.1 hypothetical protein [Nitrosomonas sp. Is37]